MPRIDHDEIEQMRVACKLGREVLDEAAKAIAPGVTTDEIDRFHIFFIVSYKNDVN